MARASAGTLHELVCPDCASELEQLPARPINVLKLFCPGCGGRFARNPGAHLAPRRSPPPTLPVPRRSDRLRSIGVLWF